MQGDIAVVAQLANGNAQPPGPADAADSVGVQVTEFAGAHPGAGEDLDNEPVEWLGAGGGAEQSGGLSVVEELGQRVVGDRDVDGEHRGACGGVGPVPFDDPVKEAADHSEALADGVACGWAPGVGAGGGEPALVALDVAALDRREAVDAFSGEVTDKASQRSVDGLDRGRA